jgi:hypothetical protein
MLCLGGITAKAETPLPDGAGVSNTADSQPVVLVELFTSQGCSSCPPADLLLSHIGKVDDFASSGAVIVPLAFHVDYWNRIGWTDPFSSSAWSERQRRYAAALRLRSVYTPQMVINGVHEFVGSSSLKAAKFITLERDRLQPGWIELRVDSAGLSERKLEVDITAEWKGGAALSSADVLVALYENGLVTNVRHGENAKRTLANDHVVRALERAFSISAAEGEVKSARLSLYLDGDWNSARLGVVAFLQSPETMRVYAATQVDVPRAPQPFQ